MAGECGRRAAEPDQIRISRNAQLTLAARDYYLANAAIGLMRLLGGSLVLIAVENYSRRDRSLVYVRHEADDRSTR